MARFLFVSIGSKRYFAQKLAEHLKNHEVTITSAEWWQGKTSIRNLMDGIRKAAPDCILSEDVFTASLFSKVTNPRIPVVLRMHGNYWAEFRNNIQHSWKHFLTAPINYAVTYFNFLMTDGFVPICKWLDVEVRRRFPGKLSEVVYQGVDPDLFYPEDGIDFDHPCVGIVQDHNIQAKVQGLLDFRKIVRELPNINFKIAGGGQYLETVRKHFKDEKNVEVIGRVSYPQGLRQFLTEIDLYVLASGLDCCPTTVLEASLMKKPVLGSAVGGVPEIIDQEKSGWSIPNENVDEWVNKIELLLGDSRKAKKMGSYGRKWVSKNFDWKVVSKQIENILCGYTKCF